MASTHIRRATALDSELIARLGQITFPGNFVGRPEPAAMRAYIDSRFTREVIAEQLAEPGSVFFIAYSGSEAVGYARLREAPIPPEVKDRPAVEIHRLYVTQPHWGGGFGSALIDECLEEAQARGATVVWLAAWGDNPRAVGFYRSLGFEQVGTQPFDMGDEQHTDLVMERRLEP